MERELDMHIAGSGKIAPGEYRNIRISGSGKIYGPIRCKSLHISGSGRQEGELRCEEEVKVSGSGHLGTVWAENARFAGSAKADGDLNLTGELHAAGSFHCCGSVKAGELRIAGAAHVEGDLEGETVRASGALRCGGLVNAETVEFRLGGENHVGSIGCSAIRVRREADGTPRFFRTLFGGRAQGYLQADSHIEGDSIDLEWTRAPRVSGRSVIIGEGCEIDLVQYTEQLEVSPNANVGRTEKV